MLLCMCISFLALVLRAYSLYDFLLEQSHLLEIACRYADNMGNILSAQKHEACDERMVSENALICSMHASEDYIDYFTLELASEKSESLGRYSCMISDGLALNSVPYLFSLYDQKNLKIHILEPSHVLELLSYQGVENTNRNLQITCSATIVFNTVTYI